MESKQIHFDAFIIISNDSHGLAKIITFTYPPPSPCIFDVVSNKKIADSDRRHLLKAKTFSFTFDWLD